MNAPSPIRRRRAAAQSPEERRTAILDAARSVFIEDGFAAARMEDVASRAGVAKGTIYLHFDGKEALFKALIESIAEVPFGHAQRLLNDDTLPSAELLCHLLAIIRDEILGTDRRLILRLLITEGHRFPDIAAFHHERVVSRAMTLLRAIVARGVARGEFAGDTLARFPQLFAAPMLLSIVWEGLFGRTDPLDVEGLLDAHLELMLHGMGARS